MFRVIALAELAVFYGCYYAKLLGQRRRGIKTTQIGSGKTGAARFIERAMMAATILAVAAELVSIALGTTGLPDWARWMGAGIGVAGAAVFIAAVITMRDSWRAGVPEKDRTELVTGGVFSISRNPAFLGFDLVYAGVLLMFFNWGLLIASLLAAVMFHLQIVCVEEKFLAATFGDAYEAYRRRVRRYLGRL